MPSGTMKLVEITCTAMLCAASDASSSRAANTVTKPNTEPSKSICSAAGKPEAN